MRFYKYTNISTAKLVLENSSLRWSSPILFNDIEECQFVPCTREQFKKAYQDYYKIIEEYAAGKKVGYDFNEFSYITKMTVSFFEHLISTNKSIPLNDEEIIQRYIDNIEDNYRNYTNTALIKCFRILCVTKNYYNKLMWAHYADQNNGCVIELDNVYAEKPYGLKNGKVIYHENFKSQTNAIDLLLYGETSEIRNSMINDVIFSKRTVWEYEEEYRFMFTEDWGEITTSIEPETNKMEISVKNQSDKLYSDIRLNKENIRSIIFGVRTKEKDIIDLLTILILNNYECPLYQMKMIGGRLVKDKLTLKK